MDDPAPADVQSLAIDLSLLPASERSARLKELPPELRRCVEPLLKEIDRINGVFDPQQHAAAVLQAVLDAEYLPPGTVLDGYVIEEKIGEGTFGTVYRAMQVSLGRRVAIKTMNGWRHSPSTYQHDEFRREAELLANLCRGSQHLCQVHDAAPARGNNPPYFVMELLEGKTITAYTARRSSEEFLRLFVHSCDGIQHAHSLDTFHRDLKPANILVTQDGVVKVIDLSVAYNLRARDARFLPSGTAGYAPPEVAGSAMPDYNSLIRHDVFSLGVILYEIIEHRHPFDVEGCDLRQAGEVIRRTPPPRLRSAPMGLRKDLQVIVDKALSVDPKQRYAAVGELAKDVRNAVAFEQVQARGASLWYLLILMYKRNPVLTRNLATAVIVILVLVGWLAVTRVESNARGRDLAAALSHTRTYVHATNDFLDRLIDTGLDATILRSGTVSERRDLASALSAWLDSLSGMADRDPELRLRKGSIQFRLGTVYHSAGMPHLGTPEDARAQWQAAISTVTPLVDDQSVGPRARILRAQVADRLADLEMSGDSFTKALQHLNEASSSLTGSESWPRPERVMAQRVMAAISLHRATLLRLRARVPGTQPDEAALLRTDARVAVEQCMKATRLSLAEAPDHAQSLRDLWVVKAEMGLLARDDGKLAEAASLFRNAVEYARERVRDSAADLVARRDLAVALEYFAESSAMLALTTKRPPAGAIAPYRECIEIFDRLAAADPENSLAIEDMFIAEGQLCEVLTHCDDLEGAVTLGADAIARRGSLPDNDLLSTGLLAHWIGLCDVLGNAEARLFEQTKDVSHAANAAAHFRAELEAVKASVRAANRAGRSPAREDKDSVQKLPELIRHFTQEVEGQTTPDP